MLTVLTVGDNGIRTRSQVGKPAAHPLNRVRAAVRGRCDERDGIDGVHYRNRLIRRDWRRVDKNVVEPVRQGFDE